MNFFIANNSVNYITINSKIAIKMVIRIINGHNVILTVNVLFRGC